MEFDAVVISPPCNSFSRARQTYPGPKPVRNAAHPWGFPWFVECQQGICGVSQLLYSEDDTAVSPCL